MQPPDRSPETPLRAETLRPGLHPVRLARSGLSGAHNFRAVYLSGGSATLSGPEGTQRLDAPVFVWTPWTDRDQLTIAPGSQGKHLVLGPGLLSVALRHTPNAADLGYVAERRYVVPLDPADPGTAILSNCLDGLVLESRHEAPMSANIVEAQLSILLVALYRLLTTGRNGPLPFGRASVPTRFVALIEAHLGARWSVATYCAELGVSREQLHTACIRSFGRAPGVMIRQRMMIEARRLLQQSPLSIDQIAQRLGFGNSPQFNRFFKGMEGVPPGRFRKSMQAGAGRETRAEDLYAWP